MRRSYPSRRAGPSVFRTPSRVAYHRRRRPDARRYAGEAAEGVLWSVHIDWDGDGGFGDTDDVTTDVLMRAQINTEYGRDQARSLSPTTSGRANLEIDNASRRYSPDNLSSPLAGLIQPGRAIWIQGRLDGVLYTPFRGHLDDVKLKAKREDSSVALSALDAIAKLKDTSASSQLYQGLRTGEAIGKVLDAIGWPADLRDLDPGVTTIRWWWVEQADAFEAINDLVFSEGPPAFVHADEDGKIIFRDRHHRLLNSESTTIQASFGTGTDHKIVDFDLDLGWRDIINAVVIKVDERDPANLPEDVWTSADVRTLSASSTETIHVTLDNPVINPTLTYTTITGSVTSSIVQDSGQTLTIELTAGGASASVRDLVVSGQPVTVQRSYQVQQEDQASIDKHGRRDPLQPRAPWAGRNDAEAIATLILAQRADRLPTATFQMASRTDATTPVLFQQLARNLSDRLHIVEPETCQDHDFFLERVKHRISDGGLLLLTDFGLERARTQPANVFTFDDPARGFDKGVFGSAGLDDPANILIFDQSGHGFNDGVFST